MLKQPKFILSHFQRSEIQNQGVRQMRRFLLGTPGETPSRASPSLLVSLALVALLGMQRLLISASTITWPLPVSLCVPTWCSPLYASVVIFCKTTFVAHLCLSWIKSQDTGMNPFCPRIYGHLAMLSPPGSCYFIIKQWLAVLMASTRHSICAPLSPSCFGGLHWGKASSNHLCSEPTFLPAYF